ncbi:YfiR family protein [Carboxylicivirga sp. M1479]|uniref:YfiR family protein n=1 Tax=Carboxylicivirga sp. M1479 TaxID=2594476 RepID=UPI0011783B8A|nr:YfiR family protein [Carboxylicivirga sp. M1479]TRX71333.1 YfiR family protein [Carboxylicivirga sp. M1479]
MKRTILLLCAIYIGLASNEAKGQTAAYKALFLYNFSKNIDWPPMSTDDELVITILGDQEISAELQKITKTKKVGNKNIKILSAASISDVQNSHIVFLGSNKSSLLKSLSYKKEKEPVLLVADKGGLCSQGAAISFLTINGKLKYEISPSIIAAHNLKVSHKVVSLGIEVQ